MTKRTASVNPRPIVRTLGDARHELFLAIWAAQRLLGPAERWIDIDPDDFDAAAGLLRKAADYVREP